MSEKNIRAIVVDDAAFMRKQLVEVLSKSNEIDVIGVARHGKEALESIEALNPDVVTLDVDMPVMDGLTTIKHIMIRSPVPVVMVSGLADQSRITFEALRLGAIDFFPKPSGTISKDIAKNSSELIESLKIAAQANPRAIKRAYLLARKKPMSKFTIQEVQGLLVVIAGQGSIGSLIRLLSHVDGLGNLGIVCLLDLPPKVLGSFVDELSRLVNCKGFEGRELELTGGRAILMSEDDLPMIVRHGNGLLIKGKDHTPKDFFSSLSGAVGLDVVYVAVLGGKSPNYLDLLVKIAGQGTNISYLSPERCACSQFSNALQKADIGACVTDEYDLISSIKAFSRRLALEQYSNKEALEKT